MIKKIWAFVYRKWLWNERLQEYDTVIRVKNWRCAVVDRKGLGRSTISPCFWWFK